MLSKQLYLLIWIWVAWSVLIDMKGPDDANEALTIKIVILLFSFALSKCHPRDCVKMYFNYVVQFSVWIVFVYNLRGNKELDGVGNFLVYIYTVIPLYKLTKVDTLNIVWCLLGYLKDWFRLWGLIIYLAVTSVHAVVLVYIVVGTMTFSYVFLTSDLFNQEQFIYFDRGGSAVRELEAMHKSTNLLVHEDNIFSIDKNNCTLENTIRYCNTQRPGNTVRGIIIRRVDGDEVEMICTMTYTQPMNALTMPTVHWYYNNSILDTTDRHSHNTNISCDGTLCEVYSKLRIVLIQESDYGTYNCSLQQTVGAGPNANLMPHLSLENILLKFRTCDNPDYTCHAKTNCGCSDDYRYYIHFVHHHAGFWKLERRDPQTAFITVPVGRSLQIGRFFFPTTLDEQEDFEVQYKINNRSHDEMCSDALDGCFLSTFLYIIATGGDPRRLLEVMYNINSFILVSYSACICPSSYGEHRVYLYRNYYNSSRNARSIVEVPHHRTLFVFPDNETYTSYIRQGTINYSDIRNKLNNKTDVWGIGYLREALILQEEFVWYIIQTIEILGIPFLFLVLALIIKRIMTFYTKYILRPLKNRCLYGVWQKSICMPTPFAAIVDTDQTLNRYRHDVFLSCCQTDEGFVNQTMIPVLERWRKRVYLYSRDCSIGGLKLEQMSEAISNSEIIIVLLSEDYMADGYCNWFQSSVILGRVCTGKTPGENVLLVKYKPCNIPITLKFNPTIKILDWTTSSFILDDGIRKLRQWFMG